MPRSAHQQVVITGAGAGIGSALANLLGARGQRVWAADVNDDALAALKDQLERYGHAVETRRADVTDGEALNALAAEVASRGPLDVWINNAGINGTGGFAELTAEQFRRIIAVNLDGVINGTRAALSVMEPAGRGLIVNMGSIAGHLPAPLMSAYVASKHAVVGFTRALQAEFDLRDCPVRLLLVSPGFVDTAIIAKGDKLGFPEWLSFLLSKPEDVAKEIVKAIDGKDREIYPTLNGKLMKRLYGMMPRLTVKSSRVLLARSLRDLVTNRYEIR
jgi:short-subunit dehydrogenase